MFQTGRRETSQQQVNERIAQAERWRLGHRTERRIRIGRRKES
jgi:hypothetical protein